MNETNWSELTGDDYGVAIAFRFNSTDGAVLVFYFLLLLILLLALLLLLHYSNATAKLRDNWKREILISNAASSYEV